MEENYPDMFELCSRRRKREKWKPLQFTYDNEGDMPPEAWDGVLTKELVNRMATKRGAFTGATLRVLGVDPAFNAGWRARLVGQRVTREQYRQALLGRSIYA